MVIKTTFHVVPLYHWKQNGSHENISGFRVAILHFRPFINVRQCWRVLHWTRRPRKHGCRRWNRGARSFQCWDIITSGFRANFFPFPVASRAPTAYPMAPLCRSSSMASLLALKPCWISVCIVNSGRLRFFHLEKVFHDFPCVPGGIQWCARHRNFTFWIR